MPLVAEGRPGPVQENTAKLESGPASSQPAEDAKKDKAQEKAEMDEMDEELALYLANLPKALRKLGGFHQSQKALLKRAGKMEDGLEEPCGIGLVVIPCFQMFNNIRCFMVFYCILLLSQGVAFGLVDLSITNFQKDYNLKPIENFALAFSYDVSSGLVAIFIAYYGERDSKIKWIVVSSFLLGFGSLLFALPFINSRYNQQRAEIEGIADASSTLGYALGYVLGAPLVQTSKKMISKIRTGMLGKLTSPCNEKCRCSTSVYSSVCGRNYIEYFSPCFAGCTHSKIVNELKMYYNCSCIKEGLMISEGEGVLIDALPGRCDAKCYKLPLLVAFFLSIIIFSGFSDVPLTMVIIRTLPDKLRSVALGMSYVTIRIFGTIPGPLLFKSSGEDACSFRDMDKCGRTGRCWIHDKTKIAHLLVGICSFCKVLTVIFTTISFIIYNRFLKKDSHTLPMSMKKMKAKSKNKEKM
uniref:Solute carrier organic anion transporter family member 6A1 n=1 Tax=Microcebus murinus TaxID=30608 RepID=A0A8C5XH31_MICMU